MATHSSILAWEIPWTEEPGMLQIKNCYTPFEVLLSFQYFIFRSEISLIVSVMWRCLLVFRPLGHLHSSVPTPFPIYVDKLATLNSGLCCASLLQSCLTLCVSIDCSLPGSPVHGILPSRMLEWVAMPSSRIYSWARDQTCFSCIAGGFFTPEPLGKPSPNPT